MTSVDVSSGIAYAGRDANHAFGFRQFNASKHAQYFTPNWLAELLCEELQPLVPPRGPSDLAVFDPTCGSGRLLAPWKRIGATVYVAQSRRSARTRRSDRKQQSLEQVQGLSSSEKLRESA